MIDADLNCVTICVIKDGDKFYLQLFLEQALYDGWTKQKAIKGEISKQLLFVTWPPQDGEIGAYQKMTKRNKTNF